MRRISRLSLLAFCLLLFAACGDKTVFDTTATFQNDTWLRFQPEKYTFSVPSAEDCYNIDLTTVIDTARYRENGLPVMLTLAGPGGETRTMFYTVVLRNTSGSILGEFDDEGLLVCHSRVREYFYFNSDGQFSLELGQQTHKYQIEGIKSVRLTITKTKLPTIE